MTWRDRGHCADLSRDWHHLPPDHQRNICWNGHVEGQGRCPVMAECWADCQTSFETWNHGTWGGLTARDRAVFPTWEQIYEPIRHPGRDETPA